MWGFCFQPCNVVSLNKNGFLERAFLLRVAFCVCLKGLCVFSAFYDWGFASLPQ